MRYDADPATYRLISAFPRPASVRTWADGGDEFSGEVPASDGMTLRDYFATAALQSVVCLYVDSSAVAQTAHLEYQAGRAAAVAYGIADAMLKERAK